MMIAYDVAAEYVKRGWAPIPVPYRSKVPVLSGWQKIRLTVDTLPQHFNGHAQNIGVLAGEPSGGLIDADADAREAVATVEYYLPNTPAVFGHKSKRRSHYLYHAEPLPNTKKYQDPTKPDGDHMAMILEVRSTGTQTVFPGSTHENGEPIEWDTNGEPATIEGDSLLWFAARAASAALLARHWPGKGNRHDASLALAGGLLRGGWNVETVREFMHLVASTAGDEEAPSRVTNVDTTAQRIRDGLDATGWPSLAKLLDSRVVDAVRDWLGLRSEPRPTEVPRPPEDRPWPVPPGGAAFAGLAGQFVDTLLPHTEADPIALLVSFLAAFTIAVGSTPYCMVGATRHALRLFTVLVGRSAKARKGDSQQAALHVLSLADPEWAGRRVVSGLSSGEGLIWAVRDPIMKSEPVREKGRATRFEIVTSDAGEPDKRLLVVESEFARVLTAMARQGNTLSAILRQAWDSGDLSVLTKASAAKATGAHIGVSAHVTEEELRRELTDTEAVNGFANRFLFAAVRRSKLLPEPESFDGEKAEALAQAVSGALYWARTVGRIERSLDAKALWADVYADLSGERPGLLGALTARAEAHCLRLSAVYALLDHKAVVEPSHILSALEVWGYVDRSIHYLFGDATGNPLADTILSALRKNGEMTRTQISDLFGQHESSARVAHALQLLLTAGRVAVESRSTTGRPVEVWRAL